MVLNMFLLGGVVSKSVMVGVCGLVVTECRKYGERDLLGVGGERQDDEA